MQASKKLEFLIMIKIEHAHDQNLNWFEFVLNEINTIRIWDSELEFELIEFVLRKQMQQYKSCDKKVQKNCSKTAKLKKKSQDKQSKL